MSEEMEQSVKDFLDVVACGKGTAAEARKEARRLLTVLTAEKKREAAVLDAMQGRNSNLDAVDEEDD